MFMGCGINEDYWSATGDGAEMKLSKTLSLLEPLKHKINVVDGLFNKASTVKASIRRRRAACSRARRSQRAPFCTPA